MKTRRLLGWVAMATMVLSTGCSSDEVVNDYSPKNAIQFGTFIERNAQSRATAIDERGLKASIEGFGVYAFYSGSTEYYYNGTADFKANFMNNQQVKWNSTKEVWEYYPIKYWPNNTNDKISFIAYYPYNKNNTYATTEANTTLPDKGKIFFTVQEEVKQQDDLLYNTTALNNLSKQKLDEKVTFNFSHALSRIGFKVAAAVDELTISKPLAKSTTIIVNSVTLSNNFYKQGTLDLKAMADNAASWSDLSGQIGFTLDYDDWKGYDPNNTSTPANNTLSGEQTLKELNGDDSYIMIIPSTYTFDITISYNVITYDSSLKDGYISITNNITKKIEPKEFVSGKAYLFNLILGMNSVDINATVSTWEDETATDVDLPKNEYASTTGSN